MGFPEAEALSNKLSGFVLRPIHCCDIHAGKCCSRLPLQTCWSGSRGIQYKNSRWVAGLEHCMAGPSESTAFWDSYLRI